ncbi:FAD-dependent oxidoreductase [Microbacterium sp. P5_E9]
MTGSTQVVVIGGGVMGAASAWQLARRGIDVTLVERFGPLHRHGASHGTARNFNVSYEDPGLLRWLHEAADLWGELEGETDAAILTRTGIINHGPGRDFEQAAVALAVGGFQADLIDASEARRRWPGFRFEGPVLHTPEAGRLHADRAVASFVEAAVAHGARVLYNTQVLGGSIDDDGIRLRVRTASGADEVIDARRAIVTAGAWTSDVLATLGATFVLPPLRVTQEQPAVFAPWDLDAQWPGFNHAPAADDPATSWFPSGVYGMGVPGEGVKAGWHGVGPEIHPDRRSYLPDAKLSAALRRYAAEWLPGVDASAPTEVTCTYTSTPDAVFVLDRVGPVALGAGFSGHGFKFAPVIGRVLADFVDER